MYSSGMFSEMRVLQEERRHHRLRGRPLPSDMSLPLWEGKQRSEPVLRELLVSMPP